MTNSPESESKIRPPLMMIGQPDATACVGVECELPASKSKASVEIPARSQKPL